MEANSEPAKGAVRVSKSQIELSTEFLFSFSGFSCSTYASQIGPILVEAHWKAWISDSFAAESVSADHRDLGLVAYELDGLQRIVLIILLPYLSDPQKDFGE